MSEPMFYIGYIEHYCYGKVITTISKSQYPEIFTGKYYPIIADSGEGSLEDLFLKLIRGKQEKFTKVNLKPNILRLFFNDSEKTTFQETSERGLKG